MTRNNLLLIVSFLILALGALFLLHYFAYFSFVKFFQIKLARTKLILFSSLVCLTLSFIAASILSHYYENALTRVFYFISSFWLGFGTTFVTFFVFVWVIYGFGKLIHLPLNLNLLGIIALILASIYSIYGVFNAQNVRIKNITVEIKNLPVEWQGKKVVQISDIHLGHIFRQKFFDKLAQKVNSLEAEAVFITGDLFDGMGDGFGYLTPALDSIKASKGTYFITGNHETYFGLDKAYDILSKTKIKIFHDDMVVIDGLQIIGINHPENFVSKPVAEIIKKIPNYNADGPSILLFHTPSQIKEIKQAGIKLMLSGHTHLGQLFPYQLVAKAVYGDYDYGLNKIDDFTIYTSSGIGAWGPTMRTGTVSEIVVITLK